MDAVTRVIGIVAEYNPFHRGHQYQLAELRYRFPDAVLLVAQSGAFVQRGEPAMFDAYTRAKAAVLCGADAVFELPFPYCCAPAEFFASGGVRILSALGADTLAFGTEGNVTERLLATAAHRSSPEFRDTVKAEFSGNPEGGHAAVCDRVTARLYGEEEAALLRTPNNLLALEYIKAASSLPETPAFIGIPRVGAEHDSKTDCGSGILSAGSIRASVSCGDLNSALDAVPEAARYLLEDSVKKGHNIPRWQTKADAFLWHFLTHDAGELSLFAGLGGGVAEHLCKTARVSADYEDWMRKSATKKYTDARLRRSVLYGYFGVTEEMLRTPPAFTRLLAANERGCSYLGQIRKTLTLPVLSKNAHWTRLSPEAQRACLCNFRAEVLQGMMFLRPAAAEECFLRAPYLHCGSH